MEILTDAERKSRALAEWEATQKELDRLKAKSYKVKSPNQQANQAKASRKRAAKRRRKSR
jgi:hypothetical protein